MNSSRSSDRRRLLAAPLTLVVAVALVLSLAAAPATAVDVSASGAQSSYQQGSDVTVTYTLTDLYDGQPDEWTLHGETDLEQVTWTVTRYDQTGKQIGNKQTYTGGSFDQQVSANDDVNEVEVKLEGTVADLPKEAYSYDPAQKRVLAQFSAGQPGGASDELRNQTFRPYSEDSQSARDALDEAAGTIDDASTAGADTSGAEQTFQNAVEAFDSGNFGLATDLAHQARDKAQGAQQSKSTTTLLLIGVGVLVAILIVAGLVYWYLQNRQTYDRLG
ncbi:MAG: hypothetical protein ABEJ70_07950 [Halobacteriaceae archaeon]